jgi:hypothetical protein
MMRSIGAFVQDDAVKRCLIARCWPDASFGERQNGYFTVWAHVPVT